MGGGKLGLFVEWGGGGGGRLPVYCTANNYYFGFQGPFLGIVYAVNGMVGAVAPMACKFLSVCCVFVFFDEE